MFTMFVVQCTHPSLQQCGGEGSKYTVTKEAKKQVVSHFYPVSYLPSGKESKEEETSNLFFKDLASDYFRAFYLKISPVTWYRIPVLYKLK